MLHNFVLYINEDSNHVSFYDERRQGNGVDALYNLRIHNLLSYRISPRHIILHFLASYLMNLLDNCVGQNKSTMVMKFFAMFFVIFFQKVIFLYLILSHSHMKADHIVVWCWDHAIQDLNFFLSVDPTNACKQIKGARAKFLDYIVAKHSFYTH